MRNRAPRPITALLSLLLVMSTTVQAGPISVREVVQVVGRHQSSGRGPELRLRNVPQGPNNLVDDSVTKSSSGARVSSQPASAADVSEGSTGTGPSADSLLSGVALSSGDSPGQLDVISQGDLEGSICDCGEIPDVLVAGGGFPKWPLLFLGVIPFFFITNDDDDSPTPSPSPGGSINPNTGPSPSPSPSPSGSIDPRGGPSPTPPPAVPEPASLLLMGSGLAALAARLRRRRTKSDLAKGIEPTEEA